MESSDSKLMWTREGPPGVSSSFRKTVRMSTRLSVWSVSFVSSKRTFDPSSLNPTVKMSSVLLMMVIIIRSYRPGDSSGAEKGVWLAPIHQDDILDIEYMSNLGYVSWTMHYVCGKYM